MRTSKSGQIYGGNDNLICCHASAYDLIRFDSGNLADFNSSSAIKAAMTADAHRGRRSYGMCDGSVRGLDDDASNPTNSWWLSIMDPAKVTQ